MRRFVLHDRGGDGTSPAAPSRGSNVRASLCAVAVVGLLVGGCSGGSTSDGGAAPSKVVLKTPEGTRDVENVTWALPDGEPTTLDPAKAGNESSNTVITNMCDSLLRLNPDWSISPGLATSAEWTGDTTFVVKLRSDAKFWDGSAVTADDVVYSLQRQIDPETQAVNASNFAYVEKIDATSPSEVTIDFSQHDSAFRNTLVTVAGEILQRDFTEEAGADIGTPSTGVMCSGPYQFVKWTSGDSITLSANEAWWGGAPKVKNLEFKFISDDSTLSSALSSGDIDGSFGLPQGSLTALRRSGAGKVYMGPSTASVSVSPTTDSGPAADPKVREALDLAIDKDAFIKNQLQGAGKLQKTLTPELAWEGDPAADVYRAGYDALPSAKRDLAEAKKVIKEAGPVDGPLTIAIASGDQLTLQVATLTQSAGKELGLDIKIKQLQPTDFSQLFYDEKKRESFDLVATSGYLEAPGSLAYAPLFALSDSIFNWSAYDDPTVTKDLEAARAATDPQDVAASFVKAQAVFGPERLQISFANMYSLLFMNNRISGAPASFSWISTAWAAQLGGTE